MFIEKLKKVYDSNQIISIKKILLLFPNYSKAYIFRLIKEAIFKNKLRKCSTGIYFIPSNTDNSFSSISASNIAKYKYINDGVNYYGIYSGLYLLNLFGISTQIPNTLSIITNKESTRKRIIIINGFKFILRRSRFEITNNNYNYYTLLQLFTDIDSNSLMSKFTKELISDYIIKNKIDLLTLIKYANKFPSKTSKNLFTSGVLTNVIQK